MQRGPLALHIRQIDVAARVLQQRPEVFEGIVGGDHHMQNTATKPVASIDVCVRGDRSQWTWSMPSAGSSRPGAAKRLLLVVGRRIKQPLEALEILCVKEVMEQGHKYGSGWTVRPRKSCGTLSVCRSARGFLYADRGRVQMRSRLDALLFTLLAILEERALGER